MTSRKTITFGQYMAVVVASFTYGVIVGVVLAIRAAR